MSATMFDEIMDTGSLFFQKYRYKYRQKREFETICEELGIAIDMDAFHNAGNDAYYTMKAFNKLS